MNALLTSANGLLQALETVDPPEYDGEDPKRHALLLRVLMNEAPTEEGKTTVAEDIDQKLTLIGLRSQTRYLKLITRNAVDLKNFTAQGRSALILRTQKILPFFFFKTALFTQPTFFQSPMAAVDLQQSVSTIQQDTNSQVNMPALQSVGEAETLPGESNALHTETAQELGFDDLFDWVKYDGGMPCDYDWTIPSNETPAIFSGSGGASDKPGFDTSVTASDPWEGREMDFRRWQNLIIQKKAQEAKATLAKAYKKVDNRGLLFVTQQQLCLPTRPKPVTRLPKSPAVVTPGKGNLKAIWKANFDNEEEEEEEEIEASEPSNRKGKAKGKAKSSESSSEKESPSGKKRKRTAYPTPPSSDPSSSSSSKSPSDDEDDDEYDSDDDDDDMGHPSKAKKGHKSGFDRKTGRLTLVGRFPPEIGPDGQFQCRDPVCKATNGKWNVGTKNGYKYHLKNVCLGNPDSVQSLRRAAGQGSQKTGNGVGYSEKCADCGKSFKCEEGFRKHREENPSTKDGKCRERRQRLEIGESVETAIPLE